MIVIAACTLPFDKNLIGHGTCVGIDDNAPCKGGPGTCHAGMCCEGCWDDVRCLPGTETLSCGEGGAACRACLAPMNQCAVGHCAVERHVVTLSAGQHFVAIVDGLGALWTYGSRSDPGGGVCQPQSGFGKVGTDGQYSSASASPDYADFLLAIGMDGARWSCGYNGNYELGDNTTTSTDTIERIDDGPWSVIAAGFASSMGIKQDGTLWAWGYGEGNRLALDVTNFVQTPTQVGTAASWQSVVLGSAGFAIDSDTRMWSWGDGPIARTTAAIIAPVEPSSTSWREVSSGPHGHACGIRIDGTLWCWGDNTLGQLGIEGTPSLPAPTQVDQRMIWKHVAAGYDFTCATQTDGSLWCWGINDYAELGLGFMDPSPIRIPTRVGIETDWNLITAGTDRACASKYDGTLWCWGSLIDGIKLSPTNKPLQ